MLWCGGEGKVSLLLEFVCSFVVDSAVCHGQSCRREKKSLQFFFESVLLFFAFQYLPFLLLFLVCFSLLAIAVAGADMRDGCARVGGGGLRQNVDERYSAVCVGRSEKLLPNALHFFRCFLGLQIGKIHYFGCLLFMCLEVGLGLGGAIKLERHPVLCGTLSFGLSQFGSRG